MEYTFHSTRPTHPLMLKANRLHLAKHENVHLKPKNCVNRPYTVPRTGISFFVLISVSLNRASTLKIRTFRISFEYQNSLSVEQALSRNNVKSRSKTPQGLA